MRSELFTAIGAAIVGILVAFFITNLFVGEIEEVKVKEIEGTVSTDLSSPNPNVFNYRSLNPTVEVYVGDDDDEYNPACSSMDDNGNCIDNESSNQENQ